MWIFLSHYSEDFDKVRQIRNYLEEDKEVAEYLCEMLKENGISIG